ncbi:MAG: glutamine--fructose-6-phosphate transaminase (isomerizing), partial [Candidatus Omnitrophica bacterium]|nr:glutamine--fructose-6-phosphate transaminase (isomerizing) [Candidatus Omnitrophota bacterium]
MCGIIGYIGQQQAVPILIGGLKKLEYRGYDSSGIGIINGKIIVRKTNGKIQNLQDLIQTHPVPSSTIGISHTRWATHGAPNKINAHPHSDNTGKITLVHNGIIENYEILKKELQSKGHKFESETDTEVIVHLISEYYKNDLLDAVRKAIKKLKGAFALGVICADHPELLVTARIGSPLIIGIGKNENFIASDVPAILEHTRKIIYLKDGELACLYKDRVDIFTFEGKSVKPKIDEVTFSIEAVQKQGFDHFMLKEVHEQPDVLQKMIGFRLKKGEVVLEGLNLTEKQLQSIRNITIVACGTAYHAGMVGKYIIEHLSGRPVNIDVSSEFRYRDPIVDKHTLLLAISQSGETADTLAAVREAKNKGAKVVSVCNVIGSSLARESDGVLYTHAGPEIGVASTKAYTAQVMMLYLFAIKLASIYKKVSEKELKAIVAKLKQIPQAYKQILDHKENIATMAKANSHFGCFLFLGRNINYPTALEGALKLKEISYIPAEGYAAGEMKHGPIALIDEYRAVVCVAVQSETYDKMVSNIQEIRSRKGKVIAVATEGDQTIQDHAEHVVFVPKTHPLLTPLLAVI